MPAFRIGLSGCSGGLEAVSTSALYALAETADDLGYESLWINEEHFQGGLNELEGRRCHSPVVLAAALAARTRRIRIGFSVLLLPLHHPVRLAEEIATLDVLSDGRVDFGISRGGSPRYLAAFGGQAADNDRAFHDTLAYILRAWSGEKLPFGDEMLAVEPRPMQRPHPPVYVGTYTPERAQWAARAGHRLICHGIHSLANTRPVFQAYVDAGGDPADVPFGRFVYVSDTDASAKRELFPTIVNLTNRLKSFGLFRRPNIITEAELEPESFYRNMVIAGSPATCAERIEELRDEFGIGYLNALSAFFGFLPLALLRQSLHLLAKDVWPRLLERPLVDRTAPFARAHSAP